MILINLYQNKQLESAVRQVVNKLDFETSKLLLILGNDPLTNNDLGECIPKSLLPYNHEKTVFEQYVDLNWECGIALSRQICELQGRFPAYFSYTLGHELGHASACLEDLSVHIHYCLIQNYIRQASMGEIHTWVQMPHEILFDQFGLHVSESIHGREQLNEELKNMLTEQETRDLSRLKSLLRLEGSAQLNLERLREELIRVSAPYKNKLITLWIQELSHSIKYEYPSLTQRVPDFQSMFEV